jgi:hypothetical protein
MSIRAGSAVALAMQRQSSASSKVVDWVAALQLPKTGKDAVYDSLQKPVDLKRLVASSGKGLAKPRL